MRGVPAWPQRGGRCRQRSTTPDRCDVAMQQHRQAARVERRYSMALTPTPIKRSVVIVRLPSAQLAGGPGVALVPGHRRACSRAGAVRRLGGGRQVGGSRPQAPAAAGGRVHNAHLPAKVEKQAHTSQVMKPAKTMYNLRQNEARSPASGRRHRGPGGGAAGRRRQHLRPRPPSPPRPAALGTLGERAGGAPPRLQQP